MEELFRDEQKKVKKRKKIAKSTLSFATEDDDADDSEETSSKPRKGDPEDRPIKRAKSRKNPNVDTSFLPDREREEAERREREELRQEWLRKQEEMKQEDIEITYSFWDGSGHRKSVTVSRTHLSCTTRFVSLTAQTRALRPLSRYRMDPWEPDRCSARKAMRSRRFWRSVGSSSRNCGG